MKPPKKRKRRCWIRVFLVLIGLFGVLAAIVFWQLTRGSVSLAWLEPRAERDLAKNLSPLTVELADVNLHWRRAEGLVAVSIGTLALRDPDTEARLALSNSVVALSFGMGKRPLLSPLSIEVHDVRVSLSRDEAGHFSLRLPKGSGQAEEGNPVQQLSALFGKGGTLAHLSHVELSSIEIRVIDKRRGTEWGTRGSQLHLTNDQQSLQAKGTLNAMAGRQSPPLELEASWDLAAPKLTVRVGADGWQPAAFFPALADDPWLACLTNKLSTHLRVGPSSNGQSHSVDLVLDSPVARLDGVAKLDLEPWHINGQMNLKRLDLQRLAPLHSNLEPLTDVNIEAQGQAHCEWGEGKPFTADLEVKTTPGQLRIHKLYPDGLFIKQAKLQARVEGGFRRIELKSLDVDFGEERLQAQAEGGRGTNGISAKITAALNGVTMKRLVALWPALAAPKPRAWIRDHLRSGQAGNVQAALSLGSRPDTGRPLDLLELTGAFDFSELQLDVLPPLAPIAGVDGKAVFALTNGFRFQVESGSNEGVRITRGQVSITRLDTRNPVLRVDAEWQSPVARIIEIITSAPLNLVDSGLLAAGDFSGRAGGTFGFALGLAAGSQPDDLDLESSIAGFHWKQAPLDLDLAGDGIKAVMRDDRLTISGSVSANGIPTQSTYVEFLKPGSKPARTIQVKARVDDADREALRVPPQPILGGPADVDLEIKMDRQSNVDLGVKLDLTPSRLDLTPLGWVKAPGEPGEAALTAHSSSNGVWAVSLDSLDATDLSAQANVRFQLRPPFLYDVDKSSITFGTNDLAASLHRDEAGAYALRISGKQLNTQPLFAFLTGSVPTNLWQSSRARPPSLPDLTLDLSFEQLGIGSDRGIRDFSVKADYSQRQWNTVHIVGALVAGQDLIITYAPTDSGHTLRANIDRAAELFAEALQYGDLEGGHLVIRATKAGPDQPLTGQLIVEDYVMKRAPLMGRLLKMSSMHGLLTTLTSKGLEVTRYESEFSYQGRRLDIQDAKLSGDLGLSGAGFIDFRDATLDISGALAPMPSLQRAVGKIPLIGNVLAGRDKEGVFAGLYRIHGPLKDPEINARPVSIFTPGITRDLFHLAPDPPSEPQAPPETVKQP